MRRNRQRAGAGERRRPADGRELTRPTSARARARPQPRRLADRRQRDADLHRGLRRRRKRRSNANGVLNQLAQYPDAVTGMDAVTERYRTNLSGNRTELQPPAVGEASRAFTVTSSAMGGAMSTTTAVVALRRGDVVASVAVASLGGTPQVDMAVSLAQVLDRRLTAALGGGSSGDQRRSGASGDCAACGARRTEVPSCFGTSGPARPGWPPGGA